MGKVIPKKRKNLWLQGLSSILYYRIKALPIETFSVSAVLVILPANWVNRFITEELLVMAGLCVLFLEDSVAVLKIEQRRAPSF